MKQSSLLNFFGNSQKRKREEVEKENVVSELQQSSIATQELIRKSSSKQAAVIEEESLPEPSIEPISSKRMRSNLKKPKYTIDSDEEFEGEIEPKSEKKKKGISFKKSKKIEDDEDFEKDVEDQGDDAFSEDDENEDEEEDDDDFIEDDDDDSDKKKKRNNKKQPAKSSNVKKQTSSAASTPKKSLKQQQTQSKQKNTPKFGSSKMDDNELINCDQENDIARAAVDQLEDTTPPFAQPGIALDSQRRKCTDPEYDPTTLYLPPEEVKKFTPAMKQYWQIKAENFDKIIFFKLGKFYELFYEDALIAHKELDLNWMGKKMHNGFPEKALDKMATKLVQRGYKVAVAEQTETPAQAQKRQSISGGAKCVARELTQVMTKGTYEQGTETDHQPRYLMAIRNFQTKFGIAIVESSTNIITLAFLSDDVHFTQFKTLLCQVKPQEIVFDPDNMTYDIKKIIQSGYLTPQLSPVQNKNHSWNKGMAFNFLDKAFGEYTLGKWPKLLNTIAESKDETKKDIQFEALAGLFNYLKSILIIDQVISVARYQIYDIEKGVRSCMILDSQSLQHLEIIEPSSIAGNGNAKTDSTKAQKEDDGSLLGYVNRTKTPFGSRLMKNWLCAPLMDVNRINDRYDSIEDLQAIHSERDSFLRGIEKLPDLEKLCGRVYKYSIKQQNSNVVYFEDVSLGRLKEFKDLTMRLVEVEKLIKTHLTPYASQFKSKRLQRLVSPMLEYENEGGDRRSLESEYEPPAMIYRGYSDEEDDAAERIKQIAESNIRSMDIEYQQENESKVKQNKIQHQKHGMLPPVGRYIQEFEQYITWTGPKGQEKPIPKRGVLQTYDIAAEAVQNVEKKIQAYLQQIQILMKDKTIKYGLRYEIEIHEDLLKNNKKPKILDFTSKAGKYQRFQTQELRELIRELDEEEEHEKREMKEFCKFIFTQFYESYRTWDSLVSIVAEIDCLSSLSRVSFTLADGVMCRPEILPINENTVPFMELKSARHPCLSFQGVNFIPNDVLLGDINQTGVMKDNQSLILLTGPNMGGKSTTLRMTCIAAIMAQLGCYVPAKSLRMSVVDRIFTRIGASDKLMEGKSTFYIEMEETSNAVKYGSKHSLIIMDELGRGTSTFDGVAIAYSILRYLVENLQSRCLFATHYHVLLDEFRHYPQIAYYHMACHVDEQKGKVIFLYRLKAGECSSSFGINVAKVVGIESGLLDKARIKAKEFEDNLNIQHAFSTNKRFNLLVKAFEDIKSSEDNFQSVMDQFQNISLMA